MPGQMELTIWDKLYKASQGSDDYSANLDFNGELNAAILLLKLYCSGL
jgi:hypothetical protein